MASDIHPDRAVDDGQAGLRLLQSLLSTATAARDGDRVRDQLGTLTAAQAWLSQALSDLAADARWTRSPITLRRTDLEPLRSFRETVRAALRADRGEHAADAGFTSAAVGFSRAAAGLADAAAGFTGAVPEFAGAVELQWIPGAGARFRSLGTGWEAVAALVTMELLLADASGALRRFKTCAYEPCGFPFTDRSRNSSRIWHDTGKCGNLVNLRAARARQASAAAPVADP